MRAAVRSFASTYAVGLAATLLVLPASLSTTLVAWRLVGGGATSAVLYGSLIGIAIWLVAGLFCRRLASPRHANAGVYRELVDRQAKLDAVARTVARKDDREAWATLQSSLESVRASLASDDADDGFLWASGAGYITVFKALHCAEQALVELVPEEDAVRQALTERAALDGSKIANSRGRVRRLERAIQVLGGGDYLSDAPVPPRSADKEIARAIVREAQATVDEFRDSRREGLVRARNRLFSTVVFTGMVAYGGLALALLAGAEETQIVAGATFYLIGATVGLFRQLRQAAAANSVTEEDFGLGMVRLVHTPLASGLAGVAGVVLTAYVTDLNDAGQVPALADIFNVSASPLGLISAAVFGFTPSLVGSTLQKRADEAKQELKSSAPGEESK